MGKPTDALAALDKAIAMQPTSFDAWNIRGGILSRLTRYDDAVASYDKAIGLNADSPEPLYNRACANALKGDKNKALADLEKAIGVEASFKTYAPQDPDFKSLWDDSEFKRLTK